jgi:hypothetical protein
MADANFSGWEQVAANMAALGTRTRGNAKVLMEATTGRLSVAAKAEAPWHDRTGNARRSIHNEVNDTGDAIIGSVGMGGQGLEYTEVLELGHGGRYRIIDPIVFGMGVAEFRKDLQDLIS